MPPPSCWCHGSYRPVTTIAGKGSVGGQAVVCQATLEPGVLAAVSMSCAHGRVFLSVPSKPAAPVWPPPRTGSIVVGALVGLCRRG